jgi:uncharacterized membrane protein HdeD (DUF308 family)
VNQVQNSSTVPASATSFPYWGTLLARGIVAALAALAITFSSDHSAGFGLTVFGIFAIAGGAVLIVGGRASLEAGVPRTISIVQGVVTLVVGILAVAFSWAGLSLLLVVVTTWAAVTGFLELYLGLRNRSRRFATSKDWIFAGALTAVFAVVTLLIPIDFNQSYMGPDNVERFLTSSIIIVGALGAYAAILAIYLVIAALSLKWAPAAETPAVAESSN